MNLLAFWLLVHLVTWAPAATGLVFTNSFQGWTGNTTYRISWEESDSDPSYYDLELVRPHGIYSMGISPNVSWPEEWSLSVPRNGDRFIQVPLGPEVCGSTNPTTITSFIPVTATGDVVETTDGHLVTHKSSEVYSSAVIYTTIIVIADSKVRPFRLGSGGAGGSHLSVLNPVAFHDSAVSSTMSPATSTGGSVRQIWVVIDGEKRLVTVPQDHPQSTIPGTHSDPFADPFAPDSPRYTQFSPSITADQNVPSSSLHPNGTNTTSYPPTHTNASVISLVTTVHQDAHNIGMYPDTAQVREHFGEKQQGRQRHQPERPGLSEEEIALRLIVPGRARDMGSLGRDNVPDVDENGLLPPDYLQATQPTPQQSSWAGPSIR
ncbi:GPI-anchored domain-containing protein [Rhizoctonia solani AG-1 IA]|uniref:GPI-anchored domain-containing protein n=1 Tax=Thanatephorus cucumeris (strain AG1-IA) TaxID=983506 RepID=L8WI89_THACA|nr:GPI-anchored domain-containing protein [Rhizoctonia solani AG-1 IA]